MITPEEQLKRHLSIRLNLEEIDNTSIWELEERMNANHFEMHKSAGIRSGHIPLKSISIEEIIEINKTFI
jgi:hypothetical protein